MRRLLPLLLSSAALIAVLALQVAGHGGEEHPASLRGNIEVVVRSYLLDHPEILGQMQSELDKRRAAAESARLKRALVLHRQALLGSEAEVALGNPDGASTIVEFFDYNCGFCKMALAGNLELLSSDSDVRLVLKDFPILGVDSLEAAEVAVAVKMQASGAEFLRFHSKLLGMEGRIDRAVALTVAAEMGLDVNRLERDIKSPVVRTILEENMRLAEALGIQGTPTYVVGDAVVPGAIGADALRELVVAARRPHE